MKDWLINLAAKIGGISKLWDFLDGKKAYGVGAVTILSGLTGLAAELAPLLSAHDTAALIQWATHATADPAWKAVVGGALIIAGAHKADKVIAASAPATPS